MYLYHGRYQLRILEKPDEIGAIEELQAIIWPGDAREIVPTHLLLGAVHSGGLVIGAYDMQGDEPVLAGFVFGFLGLYETPDGPRLKHHSHMLGVHPDYRDQGLGFALKRAQWQMVRHQGLDRITWTYDPLLSRNAHLNIARLGAVCNTYFVEFYGEMRDGLNVGLPSDRFQVDWWVNSKRVNRRLSKRARRRLDLAHFLAAETELINPSQINAAGLPTPARDTEAALVRANPQDNPVLLIEIPADFQAMRAADLELARAWRLHSRALLTGLFAGGYLVTDFVYLPGTYARSFYVLSHGESTL
jgi:predicted GNAT superfamily acetyltransferase